MNRLGIILASICLIDLIGTIFGIHYFHGIEKNPILNYFLEHWGLTGFVISKMFFTIVPISALEAILKLKLASPQKIEMCYKITIWGYLLILLGSILYLNL